MNNNRNNNRIYPDPNQAIYNSLVNEHRRWTEITDNFKKQRAAEWAQKAIRTSTLISEGRKRVHNVVEQCALMACGTACVTIGFGFLCFGMYCCGSGIKLCRKAAEDVKVPTS